MDGMNLKCTTVEDGDRIRYEIPGGELPFTPKKYGERLQTLREEAGLTLNQVAKEIGCSLQMIDNIEKGKNK